MKEGTDMGNLEEHAKRELELAGLLDKDSDYDGMLGKAVQQLIRVFETQGHSGMSAAMTVDLFSRLADFQNLTPLTSNSADWIEVGEGRWQNRRNGKAFSTDGGKTWKVQGEETSEEVHLVDHECPCHQGEQAPRVDCGCEGCNYLEAKPSASQTTLDSTQLARLEALVSSREILKDAQVFGSKVPQGPDGLIKLADYIVGQ
jgi:hypothetical protein